MQTARPLRRPSGDGTRTGSPSATPADSTTSSTMYDNNQTMLVRVLLHEQQLIAKYGCFVRNKVLRSLLNVQNKAVVGVVEMVKEL